AENPFTRFAEALARHGGFSLDTPFERLEPAQQRLLLHGSGDAWFALDLESASRRRTAVSPRFQYKGLFPALDQASPVSPASRNGLEHLVTEVPCSTCGGSRLRDDAAAVRFQGLTPGELGKLPLGQVLTLFKELKLTKPQQQVAGEVLREI